MAWLYSLQQALKRLHQAFESQTLSVQSLIDSGPKHRLYASALQPRTPCHSPFTLTDQVIRLLPFTVTNIFSQAIRFFQLNLGLTFSLLFSDSGFQLKTL